MTNNPWKCLAAYTEPRIEDKVTYMFCGREKESSELASMIKNNLSVTLYGRTGIGKTSLLEAGVFPLLRKENYFPIVVRFELINDSNKSFAEQIVNSIEEQGLKIEKTNDSEIPINIDGKVNIEYLWEYFATRHFYSGEHKVFPVIVLDQFEENLISHRHKSERLLEQIYALIDDNKEFPSGYHSETNFRFVISIREDELFRLEECIDKNQLFDLKKNRYRLTYLSRQNAKDVICIPGEHLLPEDEIERSKIINGILNQSKDEDSDCINTLLLSLVCSCLFEKCVNKRTNKITLNDINALGKNLLVDFYESLHIKKRTRKIIEEKFIDGKGRRNMVNTDDLDIPQSELNELCNGNKHILQKTNKRMELVHDLLAYAIFQTKQQKQKKNTGTILKIYLFIIFFIIFIVGMLGSVFTFSECDDRIPLFPQKTKIFSRGKSCYEYNNNYIESIIIEGSNNKYNNIHISNCMKLERIVIQGKVNDITIENCPSLRYLVLSDSVKINDINLSNCPKLKSLYIPDEVKSISSDTKLTIIPNPDYKKYIFENSILWDIVNSRIIYADFNYWKYNLKDSVFIVFPRQLFNKKTLLYTPSWGKMIFKNNGTVTDDDFIIEQDKPNRIISYTSINKNIDLSDLEISDGAFKNCRNLNSVTINERTILGYKVFNNCPNLRRLTIHQSPDLDISFINNLLIFTGGISYPLIYDIVGEGPLSKNKDGVIMFNDIPVLISNESEKDFEIKQLGDTIYACTKGLRIMNKNMSINLWGQFQDMSIPDSILNKFYYMHHSNSIVSSNDKVHFLEDSFVKGTVSGYVFCKNLTRKARNFYVNDCNTTFVDLEDSIKSEISISVPYPQLETYLLNPSFDGFKKIEELSLLQTILLNSIKIFDGAISFLYSHTIAFVLLILGIILILVFLWYLAYVRLIQQRKKSFIIIKAFISALSITLLSSFVWLTVYWFLWYCFFTTYSINTIILCSTIAAIIALLSVFFMYKNILYQIKNINSKRVRNDFYLLVRLYRNKLRILIPIIICISILACGLSWYIGRLNNAEAIYKIAKSEFGKNDDANKAALYVLLKSLQNGDIPATSIKDSIYTLLDTLSYETGYNIERLNCLKPVNAISLSPNGSLLLSGEKNGIVQVWDMKKRELVNTIKCGCSNITSCKWFNDTLFVASSSHRLNYCSITDSIPICNISSNTFINQIETFSDQLYYVSNNYSSNEAIINVLNVKDKKLVENNPKSFSCPFYVDDILKYKNNFWVSSSKTIHKLNIRENTFDKFFSTSSYVSNLLVGK